MALLDQVLSRIRGDYGLLEETAHGGVALKMMPAGQLATTTQIERFSAEAESVANHQCRGNAPAPRLYAG